MKIFIYQEFYIQEKHCSQTDPMPLNHLGTLYRAFLPFMIKAPEHLLIILYTIWQALAMLSSLPLIYTTIFTPNTLPSLLWAKT